MIDLIRAALDAASEQVALVLAAVALCSALDAALGLGVLLPGETGVVLGAIALADSPPAVAAAVIAAASGAFAGDHIGFAVGRRFGPALRETRLVRRLGIQHWDAARAFVARSVWAIIVARLLPGVRTFVSAAAGASAMPYRRFALVSGVAALLWAGIWVVGGAVVGSALLELAERSTLPVLLGALALVLVVLLVRRRPRAAR
ncbi:DedA family protein [Agrococcus sp. ARC_14]|uniref:DedA family protein n=1 Tax=Agrococcus sp. ARC_14 TaxID=2919927 RepID=UPI001F063842|nr:DedA family protein [Agrococcus sp. ARC_14]MCH1882645.1 DedA family protein [Agrococcus sp. ARC_14]